MRRSSSAARRKFANTLAGSRCFDRADTDVDVGILGPGNVASRLVRHRAELACSQKSMMHDVKAVLLVGGLGTRLRSVVPSTPKVLASVGEKSFLELLVRQLRSQGIRQSGDVHGLPGGSNRKRIRRWPGLGCCDRILEGRAAARHRRRRETCRSAIFEMFRISGDERRLVSGNRFP